MTVDDVVAIAGSIRDSCRDCLCTLSIVFEGRIEVKVIDAFEVEITFLKHFLIFIVANGVQQKELEGMLNRIQPFVIQAARVLIANTLEEVQMRFSMVNGMVVDTQIREAYAQALRTLTPSSIDYDGTVDILKDFLDSLISVLWDALRHSDSPRDQLIVLYERLRYCRTIMKQHPRCFDGKMKEQIGGIICTAGMVICSLHHSNAEIPCLEQLSNLLKRWDVLQAQAEIALDSCSPKTSALGVDDDCTKFMMKNNMYDISTSNAKVQNESGISSHQSLQTSTTQAIGFQDDEVNSILNRLTRGSKQLGIIPIVGMAGIGKTTFALKVFNDVSVAYHFQARAWCSISQVLDKKKVLLQLLNQVRVFGDYLEMIEDNSAKNPRNFEIYSEMTEDDLANDIRRSLKGKRYLILLDDVWTPEIWNDLHLWFPNDSTQSRIILTSRHSGIAAHPHSLRLREDHECLKILQIKLCRKGGWTPAIGMKIAKLCKGLPLMVVMVAGLLATMKQDGWNEVLDHLSSSGVSAEEQCNSALELSFRHLSEDLKLCLLYFGTFPEDEEVSVKRVIRLWMAEGFVQKNDFKRIEDVAREYLNDLIERNLVMVGQKRSIHGAKTCKIHDLLHDFCLRKARRENIFHILQGYAQLSNFREPCYLQRLCIHSEPIIFKNSRLFCPRARSLLFHFPQSGYSLFDMSFIIQIFKHLKVLDIIEFGLANEIPSEIELLTRLAYFSVHTRLSVIPSSIGNLSYLETFICKFMFARVLVPQTFWNLQKLKCFEILHAKGFSLPIENLENSSDLLEMETIHGVVFDCDGSMAQQMRKFPNIRRLKCTILAGAGSGEVLNKTVVVPESLSQLDSLTITVEGKLQCEFGLSENLRKLTLRGLKLSREEIAAIGKYAKLEVLNLEFISFLGDTLEMEEGEFSNLRVLKLYSCKDLKRWSASDDQQLPCLQKLVLMHWKELEEIPLSCLEYSSTLEEIHEVGCSADVVRLVRDIEEVQKDFGNLIKVGIQSLQAEEE